MLYRLLDGGLHRSVCERTCRVLAGECWKGLQELVSGKSGVGLTLVEVERG